MGNPYKAPEDYESVDPSEELAVRNGKILVLCVSAFAIGFSLLNIVCFNIGVGQERSLGQLVRFVLTVALCVCIYKGHPWARYLMVVLWGGRRY